MSQTNPQKSAAWRSISCDVEMEREILKLFNLCLQTGQFVECWREADIVCLYKKGDSGDPDNYRLLALLDTLYKVMSRMVTKRLLDHRESYMREGQFGFREEQGCADAPLTLRLILERVARVPDYDVTLLFLDWKKAFDSVTREAAEEALISWGFPEGFRSLVPRMLESEFGVIGADGQGSGKYTQQEGLRTGDPLATSMGPRRGRQVGITEFSNRPNIIR